ncbi:hypothetical protein [Croceibacterium aestuarii]|uniref:hypothetical protein n=1 Tax=Croceibacterium aestuarii TaxID=3064139 RepID=UPI00272DE817|nr:hypothetical protein [Croceibacterium sp. D39]
MAKAHFLPPARSGTPGLRDGEPVRGPAGPGPAAAVTAPSPGNPRLRRAACAAPLCVLAALAAACSAGEKQDEPEARGSVAANPQPAASENTGDEEGARAWRYTSVTDCTKVREENEEMPYVELRCDGPAGYALRISDSDGRNAVAVIDPQGEETPLELSRLGSGGFSSVGQTAEWRGPSAGAFTPDALILRYNLSESPYPEPPVPYLLAIRLQPEPCVVAKIAPGPAQNAVSRRRADDPGACLFD